MKLFLDSSVVLAACGCSTGASRAVFDRSEAQRWTLQTSAYVGMEVGANIRKLSSTASIAWLSVQGKLHEVQDVVSYKWPTILMPAKDRPILFTAAAWSEVLLTLDRRDFAELLGGSFYGLPILTPAEFLETERSAGRLR